MTTAGKREITKGLVTARNGERNGCAPMPIIREAPQAFAPWMAESPTPPRPKTATVDPFSTLAVTVTAPYPVVTPQPRRQTLSSGADGLIFAMEISGTTVYWE